MRIESDARKPRSGGLEWSDGEIEIVKQGRIEGLSSSQIAKRLVGRSRNSVIGKVIRLGLGGADSGIARHKPKIHHRHGPAKGKKVAAAVDRPKPAAVAEVLALEPLGPPGDFPEHGACKFTADNPSQNPEWRMCGRPQKPGRPWCPVHAELCDPRPQP